MAVALILGEGDGPSTLTSRFDMEMGRIVSLTPLSNSCSLQDIDRFSRDLLQEPLIVPAVTGFNRREN